MMMRFRSIYTRRSAKERSTNPLAIIIAATAIPCVSYNAGAQTSRHQFSIPTASGRVLVESFERCANATCPAVLILSGSRGFGASVYDEIGETFEDAGFSAYLRALSLAAVGIITLLGIVLVYRQNLS